MHLRAGFSYCPRRSLIDPLQVIGCLDVRQNSPGLCVNRSQLTVDETRVLIVTSRRPGGEDDLTVLATTVSVVQKVTEVATILHATSLRIHECDSKYSPVRA